MKTNEQEQARQLYIQSNLSKTEIGEKLGVNRKTIYQWSVERTCISNQLRKMIQRSSPDVGGSPAEKAGRPAEDGDWCSIYQSGADGHGQATTMTQGENAP